MKDLRALLLSIAVAFTACDAPSPTQPPDDPTPPESPPVPTGNPTRGADAFVSDCAGCHNSRDGFDLAFFSYSDATILRRARGHVDSLTARDILAHVRRLSADASVERGSRHFQPGGVVLPSDEEFAVRVFGSLEWPAGFSASDLAALDTRTTPTAVPFPRWSDEESNLDWMPDTPIPPAVLDANNGRARREVDAFYESPTLDRLTDALTALRVADRYAPGAPCSTETPARWEECFEVRRWTATLSAQLVLRGRVVDPLPREVTEPWWEVGQIARRIVATADSTSPVNTPSDLPNALENWVAWMYVGWSFDPGREPSAYLGRGLIRLDLPRHATIAIAKSIVERPVGSFDVYYDARVLARHAFGDWLAPAMELAFAHVAERLESGEEAPAGDVDLARRLIFEAYELAATRLSAEEAASLAEGRDRVLDLLS